MRGVLLATLMAMGCGNDELRPFDEYEALEASVAVECGTYDYNFPAELEEGQVPTMLCGEQPNLSCLNDAVGGSEVAHLVRRYYENDYIGVLGDELVHLMREHHYFTAHGDIVWLSYYQIALDEPVWYRRYCSAIAVEPVERGGTTCWHWRADDCTFVK